MIIRTNDPKDVEKVLKETNLSKSKKSLILVKPNLNNDLIGLSGGTVDLRVLSHVLQYLKRKGYRNVVVGDGPNTGIYHSGINVFRRLKVNRLVERYNFATEDFNHTETEEIELASGKARVAKTALHCDYFINLAKLKTHSEAVMSGAMKNLVGCLMGFEKRKLHDRLYDNIVALSQVLKPDLNIVDALIAMEGQGPGRGTPVQLNYIIAGKDAEEVDVTCAKLFGFENVPYLKRESDVDIARNIKKAKSSLLSRILLNNFFVRLRYKSFMDPFFSNVVADKILLGLGIRQDVFDPEEAEIDLEADRTKTVEEVCKKFCPIATRPWKNDCIKCLYCYFTCPDVRLKGKPGFMKEQMHFLEHTRKFT